MRLNGQDLTIADSLQGASSHLTHDRRRQEMTPRVEAVKPHLALSNDPMTSPLQAPARLHPNRQSSSLEQRTRSHACWSDKGGMVILQQVYTPLGSGSGSIVTARSGSFPSQSIMVG